MNYKVCTKCNQEFPATKEYFYEDARGKYGLYSRCKLCFNKISAKAKKKAEYKEYAKNYNKKYYDENVIRLRRAGRKNYHKNPEERIAYTKRWCEENPEKLRLNRVRQSRRRRENPIFRLNHSIRTQMRNALVARNGQGKDGRRWESLVGYTLNELKKHLEKQFDAEMTWKNYGKWHIDHVIPVSVFNFTSPDHEDFKKCWALDNLQPMWASENCSKRDTLKSHFQPSLRL